MKTKKQIKVTATKAAFEAEAWQKRREWEAAWRASVKGQKFKVESVMLGKSSISGKQSTILPSRGFKFTRK